MKTILTKIFAIAVMVFAFNTNPAMASGAGDTGTKCPKGYHWGKMTGGKMACLNSSVYSELDELRDPDQAGNESEVADSGNEGSTSSAQESDQ